MNHEVKAYMTDLGFLYRKEDDDNWQRFEHKKLPLRISKEEAEFFYNAHITSTRKTLEAVKQAGPGIKDVNIYTAQPIGGSPNFGCQREALGFNQANAEWNKTIDTMISALERKGEL